MLIGMTNLYESLDRGDTLANLGPTGSTSVGNGLWSRPVAYGGRKADIPKPDVFYVGVGPKILHRVLRGGPITTLSTYPGNSVIGLVIDPEDYRRVFVLDTDSRIWQSLDEGVSWTELTANLHALSNSIRTIEIVRPKGKEHEHGHEHAVLLVGGLGGVFHLREHSEFRPTWAVLGQRLPHGLVLELRYERTNDVLVAGFLGRGAWTLRGFFQGKMPYLDKEDEQEESTDMLEEPSSRPSGTGAVRSFRPVPVAPPPPAAPRLQ
jgi:hypothetical protein